MRPLELSLEGFTSFRSEQRLDFTELDLFAITGATGAGKSSLLDAMTFALYGTTVRTGKQVAELVSQGATTLKVQLRFLVGKAEYRVTRRWRHRASSPESKVLLEALQEGNWETLGTSTVAVQKTLEQILGMDFDTFTRVIFLPQGQFDEFLKGDKAKRREILRQLAGFEIFERMRKEAGDLARLLKQEREAVERQLADLEAPAAEAVEEVRSRLAAIELELPTFNEAVIKAQKALDEEEKLFAQIARLNQLKQEWATLNAQSVEIKDFEMRLKRSQAANHLQGDWFLVQEARERDSTAQNAALSAAKRLTQAQQQLDTEQKKFEQARSTHEAIAPQLKAREDALAAAKVYEEQRQQLTHEVAIAQQILQQKTAQLAISDREIKAARSRVDTANQRFQETERSLSQHTPGGDRLVMLNQVASLLVEWKIIDKQLKKNSFALETATHQRQTATLNHQDIASRLEQAELALTKVRAALAEAESTNAEAARSDRAAALRLSLHPGDTCPVCGGVHPESDRLPPLPPSAFVDLAPLRSRETVANSLFAATQTEKTKAESALEAVTLKESEYRQELELTQKKLSALQQQIGELLHLDRSAVLDTRFIASLEGEREAAIASDAKHREALAAQKEAAAELARGQQALQFAQQTGEEANRQHQAAVAGEERTHQLLLESATKLHNLTGGHSYDKMRQSLEQEKQNLANQLKAAETSYQAARELSIQAEERDKQAKDAAKAAVAKGEQLTASWIAKLEAISFTEETFLGCIASAQQQLAWEEAIAEHTKAKVQLETLIKEVTDSIGDRRTDERAILQRREAKRIADEKLKQANAQKEELSVWIKVAEAKQQQAENLLTQQTTLSEHEQTYHTLAQNLKANEFQSYILEHLEAELVERATLLLRELTDSRYALQIEDGEYWVEDNWNGGEKRRVRTLSGGETFATSLSMALALSEKLSMGAQLGSLFLDEGFGTLDVETLESVTQILESLRQQSRMIGVITHVRSLGERLPTQVKVYKSPAGSRIEVEAL